MLTGVLAVAILVLAVAGTASAEVKSVTANGFEVATTGTIAAPADRVYAALGEVGHWWDPSHTFSRDAANLSMELRAGGCFCERLKDGGSVQHLQSSTPRQARDCVCAARSARCRRRASTARSAGH